MNHLEHPSAAVWEERRGWFESVNEEYCGIGSYVLDEQACALTAEVQAAFCAGAWLTVVVMAMAVTDAALRATLGSFAGSTKALVDAAGANPQLQAMRARRNSIVHVRPDNPAVTIDEQWASRDDLEREARSAVQLMFEAFYIDPGTWCLRVVA
jgi:hypothetical protein